MKKHRKDATISTNNRRTNFRTNRRKFNKPNLRASGLSLLPLALRPGLLMVGGIMVTGLVVATELISSSSASAASISLSIPNTLSLNIDSASPSGTFSKSDKAEVSTKIDSKNGYTLSIRAKDSVDSNCLKNGDKKLKSISSEMNEEQYKSSGDMNTWAYQPEMFNSSVNSNFLPGPTSSETVIDKIKAGNDLVHNYGIVLAAKVNTELPAGTYKNTYVLTATSNALTYSVHYNLNDGQGGPSPNPQTGQLDGDTFKLDGTTPTKEGFEFKGWCTVQPGEDGSCSGGVYQAGADYTIFCDDNNIELYAMYGQSKEYNVTTMQDFKCTLSSRESKKLTDTRDGNDYIVAKLNDGLCWMTDNLKIEGKTLTSENSDVAETFVLPASDNKCDSFELNKYNVSYVYMDGNSGYYSWFAATGGDGGKNTMTDGQSVEHSICPKGWRLPTKDEYTKLINAYGGGNYNSNTSTNFQSETLNFKLATGSCSNYTFHESSDSDLWSSTAYNNQIAYTLELRSQTVSISNNHYYVGLPIRCVARQ